MRWGSGGVDCNRSEGGGGVSWGEIAIVVVIVIIGVVIVMICTHCIIQYRVLR